MADAKMSPYSPIAALSSMVAQSPNKDENPVSISSSPNESSDEDTCSTRYTFTPRHVKTIPRAWERKATAPFAPRNESQKIWKRVPLQNFDANQCSKFTNSKHLDHQMMRSVKRMRTAAPEDTEDKENTIYIGTKWIDLAKSPVKKRREILKTTATDMYLDNTVCDPVAIRALDGDIDNQETRKQHWGEIAPDEETHSKKQDHNGEELDESSTLGGQSADSMTFPSEERQQDVLEPVKEITLDVSTGSTPCLMMDANLVCEASTDASSKILLQNGVSGQADLEKGLDEASDHVQSVSSNDETSFAEPEEKVSNSQETPANSEQSQLLAAPTSRDVNEHELATSELLSDQMKDPKSAPPDYNDDTAFLHAFLTRAKAQKAAKVQTETDEGHSSSARAPDEARQKTDSLGSPQQRDGHLTNQLNTDFCELEPLQFDADTELEIKVSSPCRRSTRITRLPRPQRPAASLPSNISLKRLNGSEFIAVQRESQALAMTTRTNTRKNKGDAIPVPLKLIELTSDLWSDVSEVRSKKRKACKEVTWAEKLARFQEEECQSISTEDGVVPCVEEPQFEVLDVQAENRQNRKVKRMRKENIGSVNGTPAPKRTISLLVSGYAPGELAEISVNQSDKRIRTRSRD